MMPSLYLEKAPADRIVLACAFICELGGVLEHRPTSYSRASSDACEDVSLARLAAIGIVGPESEILAQGEPAFHHSV